MPAVPAMPASHILIRVLAAFQYNGTIVEADSNFAPIHELSDTGGDIYLFVLSAGAVIFTEKTLDPWYQATRVAGQVYFSRFNGENGDDSVEVYSQDESASTIACTEKQQVCVMASNGDTRCSPLASGNDALDILYGSMAADQATLERIKWLFSARASQGCPVSELIDALGIQALLSRRSLREGIQGHLSDTQWQQEAEYWFNVGLACLQKAFVNVAVGLPPSFPDDLVRRPTTGEQDKLCQNQV